ncbi:MAG: hypothetical protein ABL893_17080, partial [Hyphomicrobium sp.]
PVPPAAAAKPAPVPKAPAMPPAAPEMPPPLPAGFTPPAPPPPPPPVMTRSAILERSRTVDRDDFSYRSSIEEATVEIVRKPKPQQAGANAASSAPALPLANGGLAERPAARLPLDTLPAAASADTDAKKADGGKAATPMGRFFKALTGN